MNISRCADAVGRRNDEGYSPLIDRGFELLLLNCNSAHSNGENGCE